MQHMPIRSLLIGMLMAVPTLADAVRLRSEARVGQRVVTLGDIATLQGDAAEALADIEIARLESGRGEVIVELGDIRRSLAEREINMADLTLAGHTRCRISLSTSHESTVESSDSTQSGSPDEYLAQSPPVPPASMPLASLVRAKLAAMTGADEADLLIEYAARDAAELARAEGTGTGTGGWELEPHSTAGLGAVPLTLRRWRGDAVVQQIKVTAKVTRRVRAVVPTRTVARGERLTAADVEVRELLLTRGGDEIALDAASVIGHEAVRPLADGHAMEKEDLRPPLAVRRGELVTVRARSGSLVVKTVARALADAPAGKPVALRNEVTRQSFQATVTGEREASVDVDH